MPADDQAVFFRLLTATKQRHCKRTIRGAAVMSRIARLLSLVLLFAAVPGRAAGLPDTGQDTCYNNTVADGVAASSVVSIARDGGSHPRQDCRYGRDAAAAAISLTKTGEGVKGFDYTKIANNGTALGADATLGTAAMARACTQDNITGLMWEVKTATNTNLRYSGHTYTWYSSAFTTNGGDAGSTGTNTCNATLPSNLCNTQALVAAVNAVPGLCTHTDWRLPTQRELLTLVYADGSSPAIAPTYFPNTPASNFWSGSTYAPIPNLAWLVPFSNGDSGAYGKTVLAGVRLVRGGRSVDSFDAQHPGSILDVDYDGNADALTDGLLLIRYLFGLRGAALIQGAVGAGALRSAAEEIEAYIGSLNR